MTDIALPSVTSTSPASPALSTVATVWGYARDSETVPCPVPAPRHHGWAGSVARDPHELVAGYLCAVAWRLEDHAIAVQALRTDLSGPDGLGGELTLTASPGPGWAPTRLRWTHRHGWVATLCCGSEHCATVLRYLPGPAVASPVTVAGFAAALHTNPHTALASATIRHAHHTDRRCTIAALSRFALPEPW